MNKIRTFFTLSTKILLRFVQKEFQCFSEEYKNTHSKIEPYKTFHNTLEVSNPNISISGFPINSLHSCLELSEILLKFLPYFSFFLDLGLQFLYSGFSRIPFFFKFLRIWNLELQVFELFVYVEFPTQVLQCVYFESFHQCLLDNSLLRLLILINANVTGSI
mgnify:CR=1 FL=1